MSTSTAGLAPLAPVVLEGHIVRLEPLSRAHEADLLLASRTPEIWRWTRLALSDDTRFDAWLDWTLGEAERGAALPFAVVDRATSRAIGCTRYFDVQHEHRGLEIGYTWLAATAWRTAVNTECKYLLLGRAFEAMGCVRVQLKTNVLNARSRAAIERIGGKLEGIIRKHIVNEDGVTYRDTALYSILDDEWPAAKAGLEAKLGRR